MIGWIEKQRYILDFSLSSLMRRKTKNLSLLAVYALLVFILASIIFFTQAMKREASLILKNTPEIIVQKVLQGRYSPIPMDYLGRIEEIRGVASVRPRLWGYYYDPVVGANYTLLVPPNEAPVIGKIKIGKGISKLRKIYKGDVLSFRSVYGMIQNLYIESEFSSESELISSDLILLSEYDFRALLGLSTSYATDFVVAVGNDREVITVARKISDIFPDTRPILREEMIRTYDSVFDWRGSMFIAFLSMVLLAFIVLVWDKASGLSAEEKQEIGILKAIGWETSEVIAVKFYEGLVVSLCSFSLGILSAYGHVFFYSAFLFTPAMKGWSVLYPDFRLTPFIDPYQIAVIFFLTVVPYSIVTIIPTWRSAIVDPDSIMRI